MKKSTLDVSFKLPWYCCHCTCILSCSTFIVMLHCSFQVGLKIVAISVRAREYSSGCVLVIAGMVTMQAALMLWDLCIYSDAWRGNTKLFTVDLLKFCRSPFNFPLFYRQILQKNCQSGWLVLSVFLILSFHQLWFPDCIQILHD